jgi:hypothetical protein
MGMKFGYCVSSICFLLILLLTGREKIARTIGPEDIERK